jgi:beta-1,4-mannosyltransferase
VLQSVRSPKQTTNPYVPLLLRAIEAQVDVRTFTWTRALLGRYDVFHVHWPEVLLRGSTTSKTVGRRVLFALLLLRLRISSTAVVRTVHNITSHETAGRAESWLVRCLDRLTDERILLQAPLAGEAIGNANVILHGHYRDWYPSVPVSPVPGRLLFFGLLRPYKGVERLIQVVLELPVDAVHLHVVGACSSPELAARLVALASVGSRTQLTLEHVNDARLAQEIAEAELVVLPYRDMHNSGALLLSLSLNRPVLVPDTESTRSVAAEVGPGWVYRYPSELQPQDVLTALSAHRSGAAQTASSPDLSLREWGPVGLAHAVIYERALQASRRRRDS